MRLSRDLWLVEHTEAILDTVQGLANSMIMLMGQNARRPRNEVRVRAVREIAARYGDLVLTVAPAVVTYRADMTEAELRAWAASLMEGLT